MAYVDFVSRVHTRTARNYLERIVEHDKAACAEVALKWGEDYWDGDRKFGFGGFRYDGRWLAVAQDMARHYGLEAGARILDVGCGKAFLLFEFTRVVPGAQVFGIDVSHYGLVHAKEETRSRLARATAAAIPFPDRSFDLVYSVNTLHNLHQYDLVAALREIERVSRGAKHVTVESYETERQKMNLFCWQLTCRAFHTPREWEWILRETGYTGDHGLIFFD